MIATNTLESRLWSTCPSPWQERIIEQRIQIDRREGIEVDVGRTAWGKESAEQWSGGGGGGQQRRRMRTRADKSLLLAPFSLSFAANRFPMSVVGRAIKAVLMYGYCWTVSAKGAFPPRTPASQPSYSTIITTTSGKPIRASQSASIRFTRKDCVAGGGNTFAHKRLNAFTTTQQFTLSSSFLSDWIPVLSTRTPEPTLFRFLSIPFTIITIAIHPQEPPRGGRI